LTLFGRLAIKTTWFIPGHSIEPFPDEMKAVAEAGHEIGIQAIRTRTDRNDARAGDGSLDQMRCIES